MTGYLLTAMVNPGYKLALYDKALAASGHISRMPNYSDRMTMRQAIDVVAFVQSRYVGRTPETRMQLFKVAEARYMGRYERGR